MKLSRLNFYNIIRHLLPEQRLNGVKRSLFRWCGAKIGNNVVISSSAMIHGNGELELEDGVFIGANCIVWPGEGSRIKIGRNTQIAHLVSIKTTTHKIMPTKSGIIRISPPIYKDIEIGYGCWICSGVIILPGVTIAERCVLAAGAVVSRDVKESNCMVAGVPAVVKKRYW